MLDFITECLALFEEVDSVCTTNEGEYWTVLIEAQGKLFFYEKFFSEYRGYSYQATLTYEETIGKSSGERLATVHSHALLQLTNAMRFDLRRLKSSDIESE